MKNPKISTGEIAYLRSIYGKDEVLVGSASSLDVTYSLPINKPVLVITGLKREPFRDERSSYHMVRYIMVDGIFGWVYHNELSSVNM